MLLLIVLVAVGMAAAFPDHAVAEDLVRHLQGSAVALRTSEVAHWGPDPGLYSSWTSHSNRLIPVYTFGTLGAGRGIDLTSYTGDNSIYRDAERLRRLYRFDPKYSVAPDADYLDQTNLFDLQLACLEAGKKHIFLVVFDGMDWETTRAAAVWNLQEVAYTAGRGRGTHFQDYDAGGTSQYGWMVTSPGRDGVQVDVDTQRIRNLGRGLPGGYHPQLGGWQPWSCPQDPHYLVAGPEGALFRHAYTDSASSATSMNSGVKTYNGVINLDLDGMQKLTIAQQAQARAYRVGAVTSVPISHATPAAVYAHNVSRDDYQDLTRDLLGVPSISHPDPPLLGLDVLIGAGYGVEKSRDRGQGENFVPGNIYVADSDLKRIDVKSGGLYLVALREPGRSGGEALQEAAELAASQGKRLFGFYGVGGNDTFLSGHLPFASADGDFQSAPGVDGASGVYERADLMENPSLAEMTSAAIRVLSVDDNPFWLMVEPGDVDWANHANNLDASIGAVNSGDAAVRVITEWVEQHSDWNESVMIVTGDHGHYLVLDRPELLVKQPSAATE